MKLVTTNENGELKFKFIAETEQEKRQLGTLRNHFFFGAPEEGTYPDYDGMESEDKFVTAIRLKCNQFQS